jgi:hypothetical protein
MQPEDHVDRIDEALRKQPMWNPPEGFAYRTALRHAPQPAERDWSAWLVALERGALGGLGVYASSVVWQIAAPDLLMNLTAVAWVLATASLAWAGYVSRSLFSRI